MTKKKKKKEEEKFWWELRRILHEMLEAKLLGDIDWEEELELELEELHEGFDATKITPAGA